MGAFGAALIARDRYTGEATTMLSLDDIINLKYTTSMTRCGGCTNHCRLTVNKFTGNRRYISGNRCEVGLGRAKSYTLDSERKFHLIQRLLSFPNVTMTSHQGFFTEEALTNIAETTMENAQAYINGDELKNEVLS